MRLGRDMQDACTIACAAHARITDTQHIPHTLLEKLLRNRQLTPLGHPWRTLRSGALQNNHGIGIDCEIWKIDSCCHIVIVFKNYSSARMFSQVRLHRCGLDHRAIGRKIAPQHRKTATFGQGMMPSTDDFILINLSAFDLLKQPLAGAGPLIEMQQITNLPQQSP